MTSNTDTNRPDSAFSSFRVFSRVSRFLLCGVVLDLSHCLFSRRGASRRSPARQRPLTKTCKPIFKARCVVCHNQEMIGNGAVSGGLALDTYAAFTKGVVTDKGAHSIFVAGKSGDSELVKRLITTSPAKLMPKGGPALPAAQVALMKKWIDAGAPGPQTEEAKPKAGVNSVPMPGVIGTLDVSLRTRIMVSPDMLNKPEAVIKLARRTQ